MTRQQNHNAESDRFAVEPRPAEVAGGHPSPSSHPAGTEPVVPTSPSHEVVAAVALGPGQPLQSDYLPEQPVSLLEDRAGKPQADAGNENPDKILPEEFSPELVELERPPVQGGGANFDDFHPGSIIERLEAQGPLSQNEIRYRGDIDPTSATVSLTVNPVNDVPTTNPAAASGPEDATSIAVTLSGSDIDGTVASFSLSTLPADGTLYTDAALTSPVATATDYAATAGSRTLYFVPDPDFNGAASFNFAAKDDAGDSDPTSATATITVTPVNDDPVAADDSVLTNIVDGSAITIPIAALLANDSGVDGDALTGFTIVGGSATGASAVVNAGNAVFTPIPGAFAAGSFSYTVSDGVLTSAPALVTIAATSGDTITGGIDSEILIGDDVSLILSTVEDAMLGSLTFGDDDLVDYDPVTDTATLLFDGGSLFTDTDEIISAVYMIGSDALTGGAGDDWLDGGAGGDSLNGGAGDDILVWDAADTMIVGGSGTDTLRADSGNVDPTALTSTITGIEQIDLEADTGTNSVTLTVQDVLDISDTDILTILGDTADSIDAGTGWTDGGFDGSGNHIYTQMVGPSLATLLVDLDMSVNPDILA